MVLPRLTSGGLLGTRLVLAGGVSLVVHAMLLSTPFATLSVLSPPRSQPLEIVLVNARTAQEPLAPDALGQANLAGGGNTDSDQRMQSPLPDTAPRSAARSPMTLDRNVAELETRLHDMMTTLKTDTRLSLPTPARVNAAELSQQVVEIAREEARETAELQARIARKFSEYQKRPKRASVGANVREHVYARYVADWVAKVERIGNLNYPEAARQQKLYGNLLLTVSIRADGSIEKVAVSRPSGSKILDAAALKIVQLGAPYPPFSPEMRAKTGILDITRSWTFSRSDQLSSDE